MTQQPVLWAFFLACAFAPFSLLNRTRGCFRGRERRSRARLVCAAFIVTLDLRARSHTLVCEGKGAVFFLVVQSRERSGSWRISFVRIA